MEKAPGQHRNDSMELGQLLDTYCLHRPQLKPSTVAVYRYAIASFGRYLGGIPTTEELTEATVLGFLQRRVAEAADWTVKREVGSLMLLWRFAWRRKLTPHNPGDADIPSIRIRRNPPTAMSLDEFRAVLEACDGERGCIRGTGIQKPAWWRSLLMSCYHSAGRISAVLATTWQDLDADRGWLILGAASSKTGLGQVAWLPAEAVQAILTMQHVSERIWPQPYDRRWLWVSLRRIVVRAGLPGDRRYRFHCVRRTSATMAAANGSIEDARQLLGHATQKMTASYIDPRFLTRSAAVLPRIG